MTINLKSKKQIRGLQKRGVPQGSTVAQSAKDQNATEMRCETKNDSREDENARNVPGGAVSEDTKGAMTNTEIEQTGGNKQEKIEGREDEQERNVNGEAVNQDIEGEIIDTEIEQTGGNKEKMKKKGISMAEQSVKI